MKFEVKTYFSLLISVVCYSDLDLKRQMQGFLRVWENGWYIQNCWATEYNHILIIFLSINMFYFISGKLNIEETPREWHVKLSLTLWICNSSKLIFNREMCSFTSKLAWDNSLFSATLKINSSSTEDRRKEYSTFTNFTWLWNNHNNLRHTYVYTEHTLLSYNWQINLS